MTKRPLFGCSSIGLCSLLVSSAFSFTACMDGYSFGGSNNPSPRDGGSEPGPTVFGPDGGTLPHRHDGGQDDPGEGDAGPFTPTSKPLEGWCKGGNTVVAGDVNGDAKLDLLCHSSVNSFTNVVLAPFGDTIVQTNWRPGWGCTEVGLADVSGDGKADMWCRRAGGTVDVSLSDGSKFTDPSGSFATAFCPDANQLGFGDWNSDGKQDAWCHNYGPGNTTVSLSNGATGAAPTVLQTAWCGEGEDFGTAKVLGDNSLQTWCRTNAQAGVTDGDIVVGRANGAGIWKPHYCPVANQVGFADKDGDHKVDVWCRSAVTGVVTVALSTGTVPFRDPANWLAAGWCTGGEADFGTGDMSGDGRADAWCRDGSTGTVSLNLMNTR